MSDFVRFLLDDGSEVYFESAEGRDLVVLHSGEPDVAEGGPLGARLAGIAQAASQVADSLRSRLTPEEVSLEFGVKVAGEFNWWFFAKNQAEATINVTLTWNRDGQQP